MIQNLTKLILVTSFPVFLLISCATLNKDECRTADWKLIGFEDGSNGCAVSRIGLHRSACAEYGITPNLDLYNQGRAEGLYKYCVPITGYNLGLRGTAYQGVCSGYDEDSFIQAYKDGKQIYGAKLNLNKMEYILDNKHKDLDHVAADIHHNEQLIINGHLSKTEIVILLLETRDLAVAQDVLIHEIHELKDSIDEQASTISHLYQKFHY